MRLREICFCEFHLALENCNPIFLILSVSCSPYSCLVTQTLRATILGYSYVYYGNI